MREKTKPMALLISDAVCKGNYREATFAFVEVTPEGSIRNPYNNRFESLAIHGYSEPHTGHVYGMVAEYRDVFSIDFKRASIMALTLAKVDRVIRENIKSLYRVPMCDFVQTVCDALKVDTVVEITKRDRFGSYDESEKVFYTLEGGLERINEIECDMLDETIEE